MIYHHIKKLSEIPRVKNVFLVGKYPQHKFKRFIDDCLQEFAFESIQLIEEHNRRFAGGLLFTHKH